MKTNKNSNKKEFEENWGIYCEMMMLVAGQIGKGEFDMKEKDDSKRQLTKVLIMYISSNKKGIVFCWVVSHHGQEWKRVYENGCENKLH